MSDLYQFLRQLDERRENLTLEGVDPKQREFVRGRICENEAIRLDLRMVIARMEDFQVGRRKTS